LLFFEIFLFHKLYKRIKNSPEKYVFRKFTVPIIIIIIFVIILIDKLIFAFSDLHNKTGITRYSKVFPLYQPLTIKRFMRRHFHFQLDREKTFDITKKSQTLLYPKFPLKHKKINKYPNIVIIIIDAWRFDMFNKDVSPNVWKFAKKCLVFKNHYSGGNASRFGIFSLLYGIYSCYWHQFLAERQSCVLIDELLKLGYNFKIISSTKLTYPEFRKTAFIKIPDYIMDTLPGQGAEKRDVELANYFINWLENRESTRPFFSFMFFDAPHGPYSYPDKFDKFKPSRKTANYITVGKKDMLPLKNSYKNAIYFDDYLTGKIITFMRKNGYLKNTIIIITGDHGEEFYESGYLGHTSAFSKQQVKVPLILYIPGYKHKEITYMTSHHDVVPTLLSLLGYTSPFNYYSQGQSLLQKGNRSFVVSCGWDDCAIIDNEYTIVFSTESYNISLFEVRDSNYKLVENYEPILKERMDIILKIIKQFGEFKK